MVVSEFSHPDGRFPENPVHFNGRGRMVSTNTSVALRQELLVNKPAREARAGRLPEILPEGLENARAITLANLQEWMRPRAIPNVGVNIRRIPLPFSLEIAKIIAGHAAITRKLFDSFDPEIEEYTVDQLRRDIALCIQLMDRENIGNIRQLHDETQKAYQRLQLAALNKLQPAPRTALQEGKHMPHKFTTLS